MTMIQRDMKITIALTSLSDDDLVAHVGVLAAAERSATAALVAALAELDVRRLYLGAGCASLFVYCTRVLHLSESAAYSRIETARAARRFPTILERLADGRMTLSSVRLLARVLTGDNHQRLLDAASFKSKREVEDLVAAACPQPAAVTIVRKLPVLVAPPPTNAPPAPITEPQTASPMTFDAPPLAPVPATRRPVVQALAPDFYKLQVTLSSEGRQRLRRAQDLLRHVVPNGDVAAIVERALAVLVADLEKKKCAASARPRAARAAGPHGRHIPAAVKRAVWTRDGGQCAFQGTTGRCTERGFLEYHHVVPFADEGATTVENLQLRCAAHNAYEDALWTGAELVRDRWMDEGGWSGLSPATS